RAAPADRAGPRRTRRPRRPAARRGDGRARPGHRGPGQPGHGPARRPPHHPRRRPPADHGRPRRPGDRDGPRARRRGRHPRRTPAPGRKVRGPVAHLHRRGPPRRRLTRLARVCAPVPARAHPARPPARARPGNQPAYVRRPYTRTPLVAAGAARGGTTVDSGPIRRRLALCLALLTAAGLLVVAAPGDALAAAPCPGRKARTLTFSTGAVVVYKRGGYRCAVTVAKKAGKRRTMSVSIRARGGRPVVDKGLFRRHAGPVTVHAGQRCVWVKGRVGGGSADSGWILC